MGAGKPGDGHGSSLSTGGGRDVIHWSISGPWSKTEPDGGRKWTAGSSLRDRGLLCRCSQCCACSQATKPVEFVSSGSDVSTVFDTLESVEVERFHTEAGERLGAGESHECEAGRELTVAKSTVTRSRVIPCDLWMVTAHAKVRGMPL